MASCKKLAKSIIYKKEIMRISSKIHDYYDGLAVGADTSLVFARVPREIILTKNIIDSLPLSTSYKYTLKNKTYTFYELILGFCGIVYPLLNLVVTNDYNSAQENHFCYSWDDLIDYLPDELKEVKSKRTSKRLNYKSWLEDEHYSLRFFKSFEIRKDKDLLELFRRERIAYYLLSMQGGAWVCEAYPILKKLEFFKVHDAYETIQCIEMYLNNELAPQDLVKALPISDKLKVETHGFDPKWSFRKMPEGKKK